MDPYLCDPGIRTGYRFHRGRHGLRRPAQRRGDREYEAACLGHVSDETQIVLDKFGFAPPKAHL